MSLDELTPRERQIYHFGCKNGYREGKKDGRHLVVYMAVGFVLMFICFLAHLKK